MQQASLALTGSTLANDRGAATLRCLRHLETASHLQHIILAAATTCCVCLEIEPM